MLGEQVIVLRNVFIIEVGYSKIEDDGKQKRKVEDGKINTIRRRTHLKLHRFIYPENINGLDKQIQK
jgi:hypothetical protein